MQEPPNTHPKLIAHKAKPPQQPDKPKMDINFVKDVISQYPVERPDRIEEIAMGGQSQSWRLHCGSKSYFLKETHSTDATNRLHHFLNIARKFIDAGIPTPPPILTVTGSLFYQSQAGCYILYDWIEGRYKTEDELTIQNAENLGKLLGKIHEVLDTIPHVESFRKRSIPNFEQTLKILGQTRNVVEQNPNVFSNSSHFLDQLNFRINLAKEWENKKNTYAYLYDLPPLIHGDFQETNVIFYENHDKIKAIIDLESFQYAPRIFDICRACAYSFGASIERTIRFIEGYLSVAKLPAQELEQYTPILIDYLICSVWELENLSENISDQLSRSKETAFSNQTDLCRYVVKNRSGLHQAIKTIIEKRKNH